MTAFQKILSVFLAAVLWISPFFTALPVSAKKADNSSLLVLDDESGQTLWPAVISSEQAKQGSYSFRSTTGGTVENWMLRGDLPSSLDMSLVTQNGGDGYLSFWIFVADMSTISHWQGSQAQLGNGWDINAYVWSDWEVQIIQSGWNQIVLPFADAYQVGTPQPSHITYINIRMNNVDYPTTVYLDDIRIFSGQAPKPSLTLPDKGIQPPKRSMKYAANSWAKGWPYWWIFSTRSAL